MGETRALGEWVAAAALDDLPEDVVHDTKRLILDQIACQVGCARSKADAIVEAVWHLEDTRPNVDILPLAIDRLAIAWRSCP